MSGRRGPPKGSTRTVRLDLQYEGTAYAGWQRQANGRTVQGLMEPALGRVAAEKVTVFSSSRTDAGVHARQQVLSFSLKGSRTPVRAFVEGTNQLLPKDIRVSTAQEVDLGFHANSDALEKTYRYFFELGPPSSVFYRNFAWQLRSGLDLTAMRKASKLFVGEHDFASFRTRGTPTKSSVRTILSTHWEESPFGLPYFEITGTGFLKYMVRNIVGTLVEVGQEKRKPESISEILDAKDRKSAGGTAPPHGLFLWRVLY